MSKLRFLYACITGWTATFKLPLFYSNTGVKSIMPTMSIPPYSTIIGMLGNITGRDLNPEDVQRIGFMFECDSRGVDLEKLESYTLDTTRDVIKRNMGTTNPTQREFLVRPKLHLYLENIDFFKPFILCPVNVPSLGRSQDIAWFSTINSGKQFEIVEAEHISQGTVKSTLMPFPQEGASGYIIPLVEYYDNQQIGKPRNAVKMRQYQVVTNSSVVKNANLFKVSNCENFVIYMHSIRV